MIQLIITIEHRMNGALKVDLKGTAASPTPGEIHMAEHMRMGIEAATNIFAQDCSAETGQPCTIIQTDHQTPSKN